MITLNQKKCIWRHSVALLLLMYSLAGCALSAAPLKTVVPSAQQGATQASIRIIIYFKRATADNKPLSVAISDACQCQPVFFRQYRDNALIYIISLPHDVSYPVFENLLLQSASRLEIKSIEQDVVEHF